MSRWLLLGALFALGCPAPKSSARCASASDCPLGATCIFEGGDGFCGCETDEVCQAGQFCNSQNRCQTRPACRSNVDCTEGQICGGGRCIPQGRCQVDPQCPLGSYCDVVNGACIDGCRSNADCPLYQSCINGSCEAKCLDSSYCALSERCVGERCFRSPNPSHCAECSEDIDCPWHEDFCLINPAHDPARPETGTARFCGVNCEDDPQICPNGYSCNDVVFLTQQACERDIQCGSAQKRCIVREGDPRGFCTCLRDRDCAYDDVPPRCTPFGLCLSPEGRLCGQDSDCEPLPLCGRHSPENFDICWNQPSIRCSAAQDCLCEEGRCINSGRSCTFGVDCVLKCEDGGCRVGAACAPLEGLTCEALKR